MTPPLLRANQITKSFHFPSQVDVLKKIDFEVYPKETVAIIGKSGEGKSTLLHILGTLETPCSGQLEICGHLSSSTSSALIRNQYIGFIFQQSHLLDDETVLKNVLMPAQINRLSTHIHSPAYKRAYHLLEKVGLEARAHFPAHLLSGGEKQRVAIARALCNNPLLLLADEPSGNLDNMQSQQVHQLLINLAKTEGKGLVIVTHDLELASLCDRILLLKNGKLKPCQG